MRKLRLNTEQVKVESFPTADGPAGVGGTVRANGSGLGCTGMGGPTECVVDPSYSADGQCVCPILVSPSDFAC
jgi:hypothetical protein